MPPFLASLSYYRAKDRIAVQLVFVMHPVENVHDAVAYYRCLGFTEVWWPDAHTVLLAGSGSRGVDVMLEQDSLESGRVPVRCSASAMSTPSTVRIPSSRGCCRPVTCRWAATRSSATRLTTPIRLLDLTRDDGTFARLL